MDQTTLFGIMFLGVLALVALVLYRLMKVARREKAEEHDEVDLAVRRNAKPRYQLVPGRVYLLKDGDMGSAVREYRAALGEGAKGLYVGRASPESARKKYRLEGSGFVWISRNEDHGATNPTSLGPLLEEVEEYMREHERPLVFIADMDYLAEENDFRRVLRFVKGLGEAAQKSGGRVILRGGLGALGEEERARLVEEVSLLGKGGGPGKGKGSGKGGTGRKGGAGRRGRKVVKGSGKGKRTK